MRKHAWRVVFGVLACVAAWSGTRLAAELVAARFRLRDGTVLAGRIETPSFSLSSSLGVHSIQVADLSEVQFDERGVRVRLKDGTTLLGTISIESWAIRSMIGERSIPTALIAAIEILGGSEEQGPVREGGGASVGPTDIEQRLPLGRALSAVVLSSDAQLLYALESDGSKLHAIGTDTLDVRRTLDLPPDSRHLSPTPDGSAMVVVGRSTLTVVDLSAWRVRKSFPAEPGLWEVVALGEGLACASTSCWSSSPEVRVFSLAEGGVLRTFQGMDQQLRGTRDGRRLYSRTGVLRLPPSPGGNAERVRGGWVEARATGPLGEFTLSPDDRHAVTIAGYVYDLGRSPLADLLPCARVERHLCSAWLARARRLLLFTAEGTVKQYSVPEFEPVGSSRLGLRVYWAQADEERGALYACAGGPPPAALRPTGSDSTVRPAMPPADLYKLRLPR
ncbi:MAG: hypothetical protein HYZ53_10510 [Planctomycetes bacterium]|nr:hypothetical protein [Planctomycetota bacterium]